MYYIMTYINGPYNYVQLTGTINHNRQIRSRNYKKVIRKTSKNKEKSKSHNIRSNQVT